MASPYQYCAKCIDTFVSFVLCGSVCTRVANFKCHLNVHLMPNAREKAKFCQA